QGAGSHVANCRARPWATGDPRRTFWANPASRHVAAVSGSLDHAWLPRNQAKSVSRKHDRHRERTAGHVLAVRAVAGVDHIWLLCDLVAEGTALAATGLRELHGPSLLCSTGYSPISLDR